jgi:hypothetical protein
MLMEVSTRGTRLKRIQIAVTHRENLVFHCLPHLSAEETCTISDEPIRILLTSAWLGTREREGKTHSDVVESGFFSAFRGGATAIFYHHTGPTRIISVHECANNALVRIDTCEKYRVLLLGL